jgi:hypothetical protein
MHAQPWPNDTNDRSLRATVGPQAKSGHGRFRAASRHWFGRSNHKHTAWPQLAGGALLGAVQALMIVIFGAGDKNAVALPVLLVFPSGAFGGEAPGTDCAEAHGACSADTDAVEPPRRGTSEPRHALARPVRVFRLMTQSGLAVYWPLGHDCRRDARC